MKKILSCFAAAAAMFLAISCDDKNNTDPTLPPEDDNTGTTHEGPFSIEITDLHSSSCKITVTPESETEPYFCGVATKQYLETFGSLDNMKATVSAYIQDYIGRLEGVEFSGALKTGVHEREISGLSPEQTFIVFACHTDEDGTITSEVTSLIETTLPLTKREMTFEIEIIQITATGADLFITPSTDDPYVWMELPEELYRGKTTEQIEEFLLKYYTAFFPSRTKTGDMAYKFNGTLEPDTEYMVIVFGYDGGMTTDLHTATFKTAKPGDPAGMRFGFEYVNMTSFSVDVNVTPSDPSVLYLCIVADESYFNGEPSSEDVLQLFDTEIRKAIRFGECEDRADFAEHYGHRGPKGINFGLTPGKDHYTCAVALTEDGEFGSDVTIDKFTAPEETMTNASVTASFSKYFDGSELAKLNTELAEYSGAAILPVEFTLSDDAAYARYTVFPISLIEEEGATDDEIRTILIDQTNIIDGNTFAVEDRVDLQFDWDTEFVLYMVAFDEKDNAGSLISVKVPEMTKSGVSPASEYTPISL